MSELYLVACSASKACQAKPAKELYKGTRFCYARCYVERLGHKWFILSGKHGLVCPDEVLEPYDCHLKQQSKQYQKEWNQQVFLQVKRCLDGVTSIIFLAGEEEYYQGLVDPLCWHGRKVSTPLKGMNKGDQVSWLKEKCNG